MRRRILTLASAISLLLAIATIWPWSRSHEQGYRASVARKNSALLALDSQEGRVCLGVLWQWPFDVPFHSERTTHSRMMGFGVLSGSRYDSSSMLPEWFIEYHAHGSAGTIDSIQTDPTYFLPFRVIVFRYRGIFVLLLLLPALRLVYWMARITYHDLHPELPNRCPNCNYNLTGNTSGVCPECGSPITNPE